MLKALGLGKSKKSKHASEEQISRHKSTSRQHAQLKSQADTMQAILDRLAKSYSSAKGSFAVSRYEDIKKMIKTAIQDFQKAEEDFKKRTEHENSQPQQAPKGSIAKLRAAAEGFATNNDQLQKSDKEYSEMNAADVTSETEEMRKGVIQYKQEYYKKRDRLQAVDIQYQDSKKLAPNKRYDALKNIVKDATNDK